ncbi:hypothetical protein JB92DRAFT_2824858 [Gautieria morchelliformis]|nr:hypothetical protein JB92DRAFT_2824858 [Gautieria morchelliformis]
MSWLWRELLLSTLIDDKGNHQGKTSISGIDSIECTGATSNRPQAENNVTKWVLTITCSSPTPDMEVAEIQPVKRGRNVRAVRGCTEALRLTPSSPDLHHAWDHSLGTEISDRGKSDSFSPRIVAPSSTTLRARTAALEARREFPEVAKHYQFFPVLFPWMHAYHWPHLGIYYEVQQFNFGTTTHEQDW